MLGPFLGFAFFLGTLTSFSVNRGNARKGNAFERDIVAWVVSLLTSFLEVEQ